MKLQKLITFISTLSVGVANATATAPCNGFKLNFKNHTQQELVIDKATVYGGTLSSTDSSKMEINKSILYTVNATNEDGMMTGEFSIHSVTEPNKAVTVSFNLTNKGMICEVANIAQEGTLNANFHRLLGGLNIPIKD